MNENIKEGIQCFSVGLVAFIVIGFLSGDLDWYLSSPGYFAVGWFFFTCLIGVPAVVIYQKIFSREKKEESEKVEWSGK